MKTNDAVLRELQQIAKRHRGVLRPHDVVEFARDDSTALHSKFTWDDTEAANQYRLWQAREVIRVRVTVLEKAGVEYRAFVSLGRDRIRPRGGYRVTADVLSDGEMRGELLSEALDELERFQIKYQKLTELAPVFEAAKKVRRRAKSVA